jgi:hypothetical protein
MMTRPLCALWLLLFWLCFVAEPPRLPRPKLRRSWAALGCVGGVVLGVRVQVICIGVSPR